MNARENYAKSQRAYPAEVKVNYGPEVPRGLQEIKVPRLRDSGPGWW